MPCARDGSCTRSIVRRVLEAIFASRTNDDGGFRLLRGGCNNEHGASVVVVAAAPLSVEDTLAVPRNLDSGTPLGSGFGR